MAEVNQTSTLGSYLKQAQYYSDQTKVFRDFIFVVSELFDLAWKNNVLPKTYQLTICAQIVKGTSKFYRGAFKPILIINSLSKAKLPTNRDEMLETASLVAKVVKDTFKAIDAWEWILDIKPSVWVVIGLGSSASSISLVITVCSVTRSVIKAWQAWNQLEDKRNEKWNELLNCDDKKQIINEATTQYERLKEEVQHHQEHCISAETLVEWSELFGNYLDPAIPVLKTDNPTKQDKDNLYEAMDHCQTFLINSDEFKHDPVVALARENVLYMLIALVKKTNQGENNAALNLLMQDKKNTLIKQRFQTGRHVVDAVMGVAAIALMYHLDRTYNIFSLYTLARKSLSVIGHGVEWSKR